MLWRLDCRKMSAVWNSLSQEIEYFVGFMQLWVSCNELHRPMSPRLFHTTLYLFVSWHTITIGLIVPCGVDQTVQMLWNFHMCINACIGHDDADVVSVTYCDVYNTSWSLHVAASFKNVLCPDIALFSLVGRFVACF